MRVGVIANQTKKGAEHAVGVLEAWASERGHDLVVNREEHPASEMQRELLRSHVVVTLGGDGTMLGGARIVGKSQIPILGVNLGKFGFLAETSVDQLAATLDLVAADEHQIVERMNLGGRIEQSGRDTISFSALNDAVISRADATRIGRFETFLQGEMINSYTADGLILSTPTGSTAYNLSAGGPIVSPDMRAILVTPICPHTLGIRPLVLPKHEEIRVQFPDGREKYELTVDGQKLYHLTPDTTVTVFMAPFVTRLVRVGGPRFYHILRQKLYWGKRDSTLES